MPAAEENADDQQQRLVEMEVLLTHMQQLLQDLNKVVIDQGMTTDRLSQRLEQLERRTAAVENRRPPDEPGGLLDEKPPHY